MQKVWRGFFGIFILGGSLQLLTPQPVRADELGEILREKGMITKEDWVRIQADEEKKAEEQKKRLEEEFPVKIGYGKKGLEFATRDGKYKTQIQWRFQFRYSYPYDGDPETIEDFNGGDDESSFNVRRARIKVGGHGYQPWVKYYVEYDWPTARLLDWRAMLTKYKWAQLRIGQWKINYNRERVDSSGKQQFVERSIVNSPFTLDRQQGAQLYGHLSPGTWADSWYVLNVNNGTGRGNTNDNKQMMYMGRFQWNFLGRDLKFSQSDVSYHEKPAGSLAFGATTNQTQCPRFSGAGCRELDLQGYIIPVGRDGQYRIKQMVEEFAFKWRGLSLQHEWHWKQIRNRDGDFITDDGPKRQVNLMGAYVQGGYFPHYAIPAIPKPLEVAFRYAFVDPDVDANNDTEYEYTVAFNWFFAGHRNKLTLDGTRNELSRPGNNRSEQRIRLQWDVSF